MKYIKDGIIYDQVTKVELGDRLIINPTEEQIEAAGYQPFIEPIPNPIEVARQRKLQDLDLYDNSRAVNEFFIGEQGMWLTPAERTNYLNTLQGASRLGIDTVQYLGYDIPVNVAMNAIDQINLYAMQATNVTNSHRVAIEALQSEEEIEAYDFKVGYPQKLIFTL